MPANIVIRKAHSSDVPALVELENACFDSDKLNPRRFKYWVNADNAIFMVASITHQVVGYALVLMRKGSRSARLYSIATSPATRGKGIAKKLLIDAENKAVALGLIFMRLEVSVNNVLAIGLYEQLGYRRFGFYTAYYNNEIDALRMQKAIRQQHAKPMLPDYPWYQQTTPFTCGSAALMMAAKRLKSGLGLDQATEIDIWRTATSIYMTSGHGGSHPIGLAIAAAEAGLRAEVVINTQQTPFIDGVRTSHKKSLLQLVHKEFVNKAQATGIAISYEEPNIAQLNVALQANKAVICLISTYQFDNKKIPHWVAITHIDNDCLYLHDPDIDENDNPMDFQHIPIAIADFTQMATFGKQKLRTCVILSAGS